MKSISSTGYSVHFQTAAYEFLNAYLNNNFYSSIYILVDSNTKKFCLPIFLKHVNNSKTFRVIEIPEGEIYKNLNTCLTIWTELTENGADRKSLLINLGGGVITDMGGFVASTFKRGIHFINIPTTLLSMVDASVGGKTGVDLGVLKNQIGLFSNPEMVLIDTDYLNTVEDREIKSGLAEIIKYGFTFDKNIWGKIKNFNKIERDKVRDLIHRSIEIKNEVVLQDLKEENLRKTLNFGHTMGHAIESYFLENNNKKDLKHGEAIAIGMVIELYYSSKLLDFPIKYTDELKAFVHQFYGKIDLLESDYQPIIDLMQFDKKNIKGKVYFVLLKKMEYCKLNVQVPTKLLIKGLEYYRL